MLAFADPAMADTPTIAAGGRLDIGGVLHHSPGASSAAVRGRPTNGWANWALGRQHGRITLMKLREELCGLAAAPKGKPGPT